MGYSLLDGQFWDSVLLSLCSGSLILFHCSMSKFLSSPLVSRLIGAIGAGLVTYATTHSTSNAISVAIALATNSVIHTSVSSFPIGSSGNKDG